MRKWVLLASALLVLLGLAAYAGRWLAQPTPGPTDDNFRRLRVGMTEREVMHLLGPPPTPPSETAVTDFFAWHGTGADGSPIDIYVGIRRGNERVIRAGELRSQRLDGTYRLEGIPEREPSYFDGVRRWLRF